MFPELNTNRLILKQITADDQQFIFEGLSHPQVIPFYGVQFDSFEHTKVQMDWYDNIWREATGIPWKIIDKETLKQVGVVSIYYYKPNHNKAELGFWLLPGFRNKGIASEAIKEVIHYWQKQKNIHRIEAFVEEGNESSSRLLLNLGFVYEGKMRDCEIKNGNYISLLIYSLLSTDNLNSLS